MDGSEFTELRVFLEVAERRSFARTAAHLGVTASAVSQTLRKLEARLGVRLLNRSTRSVSPTDAGERLAARLRPAIEELRLAAEATSGQGDTPVGRVALTLSGVAAEIVLAPRLAAFHQSYPHIELEISVDDAVIDLAQGRFDAGIRRGDLLDGDVIHRQLTRDTRLIAVASPAYFDGLKAPAAPAELRDHNCIRIRRVKSEAVPAWRFTDGDVIQDVKVEGGIVVNSARLALDAALAGAGIAYLAEDYLLSNLAAGRLRRVVDKWSMPRSGFFLWYLSKRHVSIGVRALNESLRAL